MGSSMNTSQEHFFAKAEAAVTNGAAVIDLIKNCDRLAPSQRDRLINGVKRLIERIALSARLIIEAYSAGDQRSLDNASSILSRHLSLAAGSLPAIEQRLTEGKINA